MDISGYDGLENICKERILSNAYADYIISYNGNVDLLREYFQGECIKIIDNYLAIVSLERGTIDFMTVVSRVYYMLPKCYGLMDTTSMEASGILRVQNQPVLNLKGENVLVGIIDTGIDYQNPLFRKADGTTRIRAIWDQTIQTGTPPKDTGYGSEYTEEMINQALASEDPLTIVPSEDTNGHGTFAAGIIAGSEDSGNFTGAAPMADLLVVKLKPAKEYLKEFYFIDSDEVYQESDIIQAAYYLRQQSIQRNQPIVIYIGLGTNSGDHAGWGVLDQYLTRINASPGESVSLPAGNEGNARHHFYGTVEGNVNANTVVEVNVGSNEPGLILELWGNNPNTYAIGIESPYGEVIDRIPPRFQSRQRIDFLLERTVIDIAYVLVEELSGKELIFIRMREPTEGIWRFRVYAAGSTENGFHIWMPIRNFISDNTYFLQPDPSVTLTEPSAAEGPICVTAYNHYTGSLYYEAGRGYTSDGGIKPDLAAPGVDVYGPDISRLPNQAYGYTVRSGTSIAAAHTAGAAALLMEWAEKRKNITRMSGTQVKLYLIRGAMRRGDLTYPNPLWGYGTLDLYGVFQGLQQGLP